MEPGIPLSSFLRFPPSSEVGVGDVLIILKPIPHAFKPFYAHSFYRDMMSEGWSAPMNFFSLTTP